MKSETERMVLPLAYSFVLFGQMPHKYSPEITKAKRNKIKNQLI